MYTEEELLGEIKELLADEELYEMYERAFREYHYYFETTNYIVLNVYGFNDHGPIHVLLTTRRALELLNIIRKFGIHTTAEKLGKPFRWSKFIVAFGALFHDIGNMIHRINHYEFSVFLAEPIIEKLVGELKTDDPLLLKAMTLNAIYTHDEHVPCTTIEGSLVTIADGCDMEAGRSRLVHKKDKVDIHAVSALAIERVEIKEGNEEQPILIEISMKHPAGIFQVDEILTKKVKSSLLSGRVKLRIRTGTEVMEKVI
ncbi:putative metal-dependent phosphohydrolase [Thermococcus cleftensis]|uniref:Metal-dependent phosphohydrolase n=1 Tax=Thermococcus cleftensis (strain DSM 27260 / KACC 17922 / CL1) TaxID=163003 RepID=I3ZT98_THECF|nr:MULTISPECIES: metal-dependent phosphohydrolase [Thermococcus]AFL94932.1 putative metal-dependent phosphohydrolase [Thermococcus cleftensis]NJE03733.1 metal-dependent phosphohydrolase [Thermococcus sp. MV11]